MLAKRTADQNEDGNLRAAFNEFDVDDNGASSKNRIATCQFCVFPGYVNTRELCNVLRKLGRGRMSDVEVTF